MAGGTTVLSFNPNELTFKNVQFGQVYTKTIAISNTLKGTVEATIRTSADRLTCEPTSIRLRAGETQQCNIRLRVLKFANKAKAVEQGQRDVLHVKGPFFDQKVYVTFLLAADAEEPAGKSAALQQPGNLSPRSRLPPRPMPSTQQTAATTAASSAAAGRAGLSPERPSKMARAGLPMPTLQQSTGNWAQPVQRGSTSQQQMVTRTRSAQPGSLGSGTRSGTSSPTLAPGSPTGSISLATSSEDQPRQPRAAPVPMPRQARASFEFQPGAAAAPAATGSSRPPAAPAAGHQQPRFGLIRSAPASPDSHSPVAQWSPGAAARPQQHTRYAAPDTARSPPQTSRAGCSRGPCSHSADLSSTVIGSRGSSLSWAADESEPMPRSPSMALQSALRSLGQCSPGSHSSPPTRRPSPAREQTATSQARAGPHPERPVVNKIPLPHAPDPAVKVSGVVPDGHLGFSRQPTSPQQQPTAPAQSPSRRAQIGESTAAIRAAFTNIAAMANPTAQPGMSGETDTGRSATVAPLPASALQPSDSQQTARSRGSVAQATAVATSPTHARRLQQPQLAGNTQAERTYRCVGGPNEVDITRRTAAISPPASPVAGPQPDPPTVTASPPVGVARPHAVGARSELQASLEALRAHTDGQRAEMHGRLREAESQLSSLQMTASSQLQALADRETTIQVLQAKLAASRKAQALESSQSAPPAWEVEARELRLKQQQAQAQIRELEAQAERHRSEAAALKKLNAELQSRAPEAKRLIEAAVERQQVMQEERNRKALELLLAKDERIKELEGRVEDTEHQLGELQRTCSSTLAQLEASQAQILDVLRDKDRLRQDTDWERQQQRQQLADLHAQLAALSGAATEQAATKRRANDAEESVAKLSSQVASQSQDLGSCRDEAARLLQELAHAKARIQFLEQSAEESRQAHAQHVQRTANRYQGQMAELHERSKDLEQVVEQQKNQLGSIYSAGLGSRLPNLGLQPGASAQDLLRPSLEQQLLAAQALNTELEAALHQARAQQALQGPAEVGTRESKVPAASAAEQEAAITTEFELSRLRDLLTSRDRELVLLRSELSLAGVAREEPDERMRGLSLQLAEAQVALQLAQEKIVSLEARASIAAEQNPDSDALKRELAAARAELRRSRTDLELAHTTAARLNARITEVATAEAEARDAAHVAQNMLAAEQELHAREIAAVEERLTLKAEAAKGRAGGQSSNESHPPPPSSPRAAPAGTAEAKGRASCVATSVREEKLKEALEAALARATAQEAMVAEAQDRAARKAVQVHGTMSSELAVLTRKVSDTDLELGRVRAELERRTEALNATAAQLRTAQAAVTAAQGAAKRTQEAAAAENQALREELQARQRDLTQALHQGDQRHAQVMVLMETIEALQAGTPGEQEQQLLALTAQLAASRSNESMYEQRCNEITHECGAAQQAAGRARVEAQSAQAVVQRVEQQLAAAAGLVHAREQQLEAARQEAQAQAEASMRMARELDSCASRCASLEAESEGMRATLRDIQVRHVEQITREREEAAENIRYARNEVALAGSKRVLHGAKPFTSRVVEPLQDLLEFVGRKAASMEGGDRQGFEHVMQELQSVLPQLEQLYHQAATEAITHRGAEQAAQRRAAAQAAVLEARTAEWQAAQVTGQRLQRLASRRAEQATSHAIRMVQELRARTAMLGQQLDASMSAEVKATAQLAVVQAALAEEKAGAGAAAAHLALAQADVKHLSARLAAANLEHAAAQQQVPGFEAPRYLEELVQRLDSRQEGRERLMGLIRELAAVKQSEALMRAQLTSAQKQADTATLSGQALREAAKLAATQLAALQREIGNEPAPGSVGGASWDSTHISQAPGRGLDVLSSTAVPQWADGLAQGHEIARLRVQLVVSAKEAGRLKDKLLEAQQALESREADVSELHAGAAAHQLLLQQQQDEAAMALLQQRQQLDDAHEADRQLLLREITEMQARMATLRELSAQDSREAEARLVATRTAVGNELDAALGRALQGYVPESDLQTAQEHAELSERNASRLQQQLEALQGQLVKEKAKVMELMDVKEVTATAVSRLEDTLASIEAAAQAGVLTERVNKSKKGADKGAGPATIDALSRELVRAKLAEADAVCKLRVSARAELDLRQRLLQRDERILELKEQREAGGRSGATRGRSHSPKRVRGRAGQAHQDVSAEAVGRPGARSAARTRPAAARSGAEPSSLAAARSECEHLNGLLTQARLQAARRDAEIQRLQVELATAITRQHQPEGIAAGPARTSPSKTRDGRTSGQMYAELSLANTALATSLTTVHSILRQLGSLAASPGRYGPQDTSNLPHALGTALQQLAAEVRERMGRPPLPPAPATTLLLPSFSTSTPSARAAIDNSPSISAHLSALKLQQAEARCQELQQRVEELTHTCALQPQPSAYAQERQQNMQAGATASRDGCMQPAQSELQAMQHQRARSDGNGVQAERLSISVQSSGVDMAQAQRLLSLLQQSSGALQAACQELEAVCLLPQPHPRELQHTAATVVSELLGLEAAINMLSAELSKPPQAALPQQPEDTPRASYTADDPHAAHAQPSAPRAPPAKGGFTFPAAAPSPAPSSASWVTVQGGMDAPTGLERATDTPSSCSSSEPSLSGVLHNRSHALASMQAVAVLDPAPATSNLLAERLLQQRGRADKWKTRARELGQQLALLGAGSAARDAAVCERVVAAERATDEQALRHKAELNRLQAALAGAEAARQELEKDWSASACGPASGHSDSSAAVLAELRARCAALERHLDTQQAQASAAHGALAEEAARLRGALAQEQGERARLLGGMRDALAGLRATGDTEGRMRAELLRAHQDAAAARSAHERAEAHAMARQGEAQAVRERLQASEKARSDIIQRMQTQLNSASLRCDRVAEMAAVRIDELAVKLTASAATATTPYEAAELRLRHLEDDLQALAARLQAACAEHEQDMAGERLTRTARAHEHERVVEALSAELEANKQAAVQQLAELQVRLSDAVRRGEKVAEELRTAQQQVAEAAVAAEAERQRLTEQQLAHITELQARLEEERRAVHDEAALRCESAAASREHAAAAAGAASLAEQGAAYSAQLAASQAACSALQQQIAQLQATFRAFQQQKAVEIASLEERVVACIGRSPMPVAGDQVPLPAGKAPKLPANRRGPGGSHGGVGRPRVAIKPRANGLLKTRADKAHGLERVNAPWLQTPLVDTSAGLGAMGAAAGEMAEAAAADAVAAARRDALFERLQRQQAEAQLCVSRRAVQTLRTRLRLAQRQLEALRSSCVMREEHARVLNEMERLRDTLRNCRAESNRRQRALQLMQGLATAGGAQGHGDAEHARLVAAAVSLAAAEQQAAQATGMPEDVRRESGAAAAAGASHADPYMQVASTAAAAASQASSALAQEREVRALLEAKLREAQAAGARKQQLAKELKQRVVELEEQLTSSQTTAAAAAATAQLEAKLRQATAAVLRKDMLLKELKTQLEACTAKDSAAGDASSRDQAARDARMITRLRSEVARKEVSLQAVQAELQTEKDQAESAQAALQLSRRQHRSALHQSRDLMAAVRDLLRLLLRCSAVASTASAKPSSSQGETRQAGGQAVPHVASSLAGIGIRSGMSMDDIASLTSLSVGEVQDLLDPGAAQRQLAAAGPASRNTAAMAAARERCECLLQVLEATLLPAAELAAAGEGAAQSAHDVAVADWDPRDLRLLVSCAEQEVAAVERALGVAAS